MNIQEQSRHIAKGWDYDINKSVNAGLANIAGLKIKSDINASWLKGRCTIKQAKKLIDLEIWESFEEHHHSRGNYRGKKKVALIKYYDLKDLDKIIKENKNLDQLIKCETKKKANTSPRLEVNKYQSIEGKNIPEGWQLASDTEFKDVEGIEKITVLSCGVHFAFYNASWNRIKINRYGKLAWVPERKLILPTEDRKLKEIAEAIVADKNL